MALPRFCVDHSAQYRRSASNETQGDLEFCKVLYQPADRTAALNLFVSIRKPGVGARFGSLGRGCHRGLMRSHGQNNARTEPTLRAVRQGDRATVLQNDAAGD